MMCYQVSTRKMHAPPVAHRTVKPRDPSRKPYLPILAYTEDVIYREREDTYHDGTDIFALVVTEPPSLIVAQGVARLLYELHSKFYNDPLWQFACSPIEQTRMLPDGKKSNVTRTDTMVTFLGFRGKPLPDGPRGGKRNEPNRYHTTLDPITFIRKGIRELHAADPALPEVEQLYVWAAQVRRFCAQQGLKLRPTSGSVSGQFLRDRRFYPNARRKVPGATNAKARPAQPGNHYALLEDVGTEFDAYYLDQVSAHHNCARDIVFPHANHLNAYGHFRTLEDKPGVPLSVLKCHGLIYAKIQCPHFPRGAFPPPWAAKHGTHLAYIHTNELPLVRELGIQIEYIVAAWVSNCRDFGLNRYAAWCLAQLSGIRPEERAWKKPLLLSAYGILATTPRAHRTGYAKCEHGTQQLYPAGAGFLPVLEHKTDTPSEPGYANVIHRGMIEAETRLRSLKLARDLHTQGFRVAAVYADSVFIHARNVDEENVPIPIPPEGWRLDHVLTRLRFHNPVSFSSDQMTKLPGVPGRDAILRASRGVSYQGAGRGRNGARRHRAN